MNRPILAARRDRDARGRVLPSCARAGKPRELPRAPDPRARRRDRDARPRRAASARSTTASPCTSATRRRTASFRDIFVNDERDPEGIAARSPRRTGILLRACRRLVPRPAERRPHPRRSRRGRQQRRQLSRPTRSTSASSARRVRRPSTRRWSARRCSCSTRAGRLLHRNVPAARRGRDPRPHHRAALHARLRPDRARLPRAAAQQPPGPQRRHRERRAGLSSAARCRFRRNGRRPQHLNGAIPFMYVSPAGRHRVRDLRHDARRERLRPPCVVFAAYRTRSRRLRGGHPAATSRGPAREAAIAMMPRVLSRYIARRFTATLALILASPLRSVIFLVSLRRRAAPLQRRVGLQRDARPAARSHARAAAARHRRCPSRSSSAALLSLLGLSRKLELVVARASGVSVWGFLRAPFAGRAHLRRARDGACSTRWRSNWRKREARSRRSCRARSRRQRALVPAGGQRPVLDRLRGSASVDSLTLFGVTAFVFDAAGKFREKVTAPSATYDHEPLDP